MSTEGCPFSWMAQDRVAAAQRAAAAYGTKPDAERSRYYRLLWELG